MWGEGGEEEGIHRDGAILIALTHRARVSEIIPVRKKSRAERGEAGRRGRRKEKESMDGGGRYMNGNAMKATSKSGLVKSNGG